MNRTLEAIVILLVTSAAAGAQTTSERLMLERTAATREEVVVAMDNRGGRIRGTLLDATDIELEIQTRSGPRFLNLAQVSWVERPGDSVLDGVLRGMGAATTWCTLMCAPIPDDRQRARVYLSRVALGGLIGGFIDGRVNGGQTLYRRTLTPPIEIGIGRSGVQVTIEY